MQRTAAFWIGATLVLAGILFMLVNFNVLDLDWDVLTRLWPVALILVGVGVLTRQDGFYAAAMAVFVLALLASMAKGVSYIRDELDEQHNRPATERLLSSDTATATAERARFIFRGGAGEYRIQGTSERLVSAETSTTHGTFSLRSTDDDDTPTVRLEQGNPGLILGGVRNRATIRLSEQPEWELDLEAGAADVQYDLAPFNVRKAEIETGAASVNVRFGSRAENAEARFRVGASSLTIQVPQEVGTLVRLSTGLSSKNLNGFVQNGDEYRSEGYDATTKKLTIDVEAGVSSITVDRY